MGRFVPGAIALIAGVTILIRHDQFAAFSFRGGRRFYGGRGPGIAQLRRLTVVFGIACILLGVVSTGMMLRSYGV